jgi:hypothetical protein
MLRSVRWRCSHRLFPSLCGRVAQSHQFWARRLRFDLNPEPDHCYHCEGRHSLQCHRVSSQALVPLDTQQHTAILTRQARRIYDHTVWVTCEWRQGKSVSAIGVVIARLRAYPETLWTLHARHMCSRVNGSPACQSRNR